MGNEKPIGIFDSGIGGLSVFSELIKLIPGENYIYFGDTLNLPYGNKTKDELIRITKNIFDFFESKKVKAVVMACNTTSAVTYGYLKDKYEFKIYPVVQSVSKSIADKNYNRVGVFATAATINSHAYKKEINIYNPKTSVFEIACPEWVNIVENQLQNEEESINNIRKHLNEMLPNNVEKIILGCTHYPYLMNILSKYADSSLFINPAKAFSEYIVLDLKRDNLLNNKRTCEPKFYVSSNPEHFKSASGLFYKINDVEEISPEKVLY